MEDDTTATTFDGTDRVLENDSDPETDPLGKPPTLDNNVDLGGVKAGATTARVEFETDKATTV